MEEEEWAGGAGGVKADRSLPIEPSTRQQLCFGVIQFRAKAFRLWSTKAYCEVFLKASRSWQTLNLIPVISIDVLARLWLIPEKRHRDRPLKKNRKKQKQWKRIKKQQRKLWPFALKNMEIDTRVKRRKAESFHVPPTIASRFKLRWNARKSFIM